MGLLSFLPDLVKSKLFINFGQHAYEKIDDEEELGNIAIRFGDVLVKRQKISSLAALSEKNIAYFPVVISNSLPYDKALNIVKGLEMRFAAFIELIYTQNDFIDLTDNKTKYKFFNEKIKNSNIFNEAEINTYVSSSISNTIDKDLNNKDFTNSLNPRILNEDVKADASYEYKNLNTMKPTIITVEVNAITGTNAQPVKTSILIAVKAVAHIIDGTDLTDAIIENQKVSGSMLTKFLRWTSGELRFWRDFVFDLENISKSFTKGKKGYNFVYRLKTKALKTKLDYIINGKDIIPTTTLVLSRNEVLQIKESVDLNLESAGVASNFCKNLNLSTLVIIDQDNEIVNILDDFEQSDFQVFSLADFNSKDSGDDKMRKQLFKLMQMGR